MACFRPRPENRLVLQESEGSSRLNCGRARADHRRILGNSFSTVRMASERHEPESSGVGNGGRVVIWEYHVLKFEPTGMVFRGGKIPDEWLKEELNKASCRGKSVDLGGRRIIKKKPDK